MAVIAFRLDAGPSIGFGHLIRCTALAGALAALGHQVLFLCRGRPNVSPAFTFLPLSPPMSRPSEAGYQIQDISDELPELGALLAEARADCLIVDHYGASECYLSTLRGRVPLLVAIDDDHSRRLPVDLVINGNIYAGDLSYPEASSALLGPQYLLLRQEFQLVPHKTIVPRVRRIYLTSGGADPLRFCEAAIGWIQEIHDDTLQIFAIVGPGFSSDYIQHLETAYPEVQLCFQADMRACMEDADLFITSAGSTLYELAACGVPNLCCILAKNQVRIAQAMDSSGYSCCLGLFEEIEDIHIRPPLRRMLEDHAYRMEMSVLAQSAFTGHGAQNVARSLTDLFL